MEKWECTVCGHIYDPATGDTATAIDPQTPFDDLPDEWTCPECGAEKDTFEMI